MKMHTEVTLWYNTCYTNQPTMAALSLPSESQEIYERDIKNYPDRGQCYLPKPKAEADNIAWSSY